MGRLSPELVPSSSQQSWGAPPALQKAAGVGVLYSAFLEILNDSFSTPTSFNAKCALEKAVIWLQNRYAISIHHAFICSWDVKSSCG